MTDGNPEALRNTLDTAAEAIRDANHQTLPHNGTPGLQAPADVYSACQSLMILHQREPQLLTQLARWLEREYAEGRVTHATAASAEPAVLAASDALTRAVEASAEAERALAQALNACTSLKAPG